jgi:hypothetical protein
LDAVAAQATVIADALDFEQAPVDLPANFCRSGKFANPLFTPKSLALRKVPSVRHGRAQN